MNSLSKAQLIENISKENIPIIIFGAGIVSEALYHSSVSSGIKIECFCDNNLNKTNTKLCGVPIIHTSQLKQKFNDARFLISAADIRDVIEQLCSLGYSKWSPAAPLLREFDISEHKFSAPHHFVEYAVATCLLCHDSYSNPDKLFLRSVDIIITERCSLKCKDCSNLMQYYKKPIDCDTAEILESIDMFCSVIDEVNEFRVIGGEPFMNKEFHLLINRLVNEPKVKKIVIYTNGTIVPPIEKLQSLKNKKVLIIITDYGKPSKKIDDLISSLSENNIDFYRQNAKGWTDCSKIIKHNRTALQQKEIFQRCCAKNTVSLSDGRLYRCPFAANAARLRAVPDFETDYVNISHDLESSESILNLKKKIRAYLMHKEFLETCEFCNGRSFGDPEIEPAVQIHKPLEYTQYN